MAEQRFRPGVLATLLKDGAPFKEYHFSFILEVYKQTKSRKYTMTNFKLLALRNTLS